MKTPMYDYMYRGAFLGALGYKNSWIRSMLDRSLEVIDQSRIFKIPKDLSNMFIFTDPIETYLLPFENLFLEQNIIIDKKTEIRGILLHQLNYEQKNLLPNPDENMIWVFCNMKTDNKPHSFSFLLSKSQGEREPIQNDQDNELFPFTEETDKQIKWVENLIFNFLCFVNSPDIEYKTVIDSKRDTEIRRRKGKPQRPPIANIVLTNPLKRYIYKQKHNEKMIYSHRFWVRGHWRTLRDKRYGENQGKKLWIKPYIKGDGLLINKKYELRT